MDGPSAATREESETSEQESGAREEAWHEAKFIRFAQPGQNWEGTRAKKKYEERARKAAGRGSGRGSSMQEKGPETVTLTHQSEAMVRDLLDKLGKRSGKQAHQGEDIEGEEGEEEGTEDEPERAERNPNVDEEDLKKKVREELHKKGFEQGRTEEAIGEGLAAETDDDRAQNFNQQKKRLLDRAKDWVRNLKPLLPSCAGET